MPVYVHDASFRIYRRDDVEVVARLPHGTVSGADEPTPPLAAVVRPQHAVLLQRRGVLHAGVVGLAPVLALQQLEDLHAVGAHGDGAREDAALPVHWHGDVVVPAADDIEVEGLPLSWWPRLVLCVHCGNPEALAWVDVAVGKGLHRRHGEAALAARHDAAEADRQARHGRHGPGPPSARLVPQHPALGRDSGPSLHGLTQAQDVVDFFEVPNALRIAEEGLQRGQHPLHAFARAFEAVLREHPLLH
mmetsp:Transcript_123029/g.359116  ORF Transcript_123029/g.359116 Transcript_123029/m.359116 type:complete len:247 (+) Transcript_123029:62-802(+)